MIGYADDEYAQCVVVQSEVRVQNDRIPHITISFRAGQRSSYSNTLLTKGWQCVDEELELYGKLALLRAGTA